MKTAAMLIAAVIACAPLFLADFPWPQTAANHLEQNGQNEAAAPNLVSGIYLAYRLFDTIGETLILLASISGTIALIQTQLSSASKKKIVDTADMHKIRVLRRRTDLLETVTGKIGPVVLMFGVYVMCFGHVSPGGGFQGGAVVASGIIFLAIGGRTGFTSMIAHRKVLSTLETVSLLLLLAAASFSAVQIPGAPYGLQLIIIMNIIIGIKVGSGISLMCLVMIGTNYDD